MTESEYNAETERLCANFAKAVDVLDAESLRGLVAWPRQLPIGVKLDAMKVAGVDFYAFVELLVGFGPDDADEVVAMKDPTKLAEWLDEYRNAAETTGEDRDPDAEASSSRMIRD